MKKTHHPTRCWRELARALAAVIVVLGGPVIADEPTAALPQSRPVPKSTVIDPNKTFYPAKAQRLGQEGRVVLAFDIGADGLAKNTVVATSEEPALNAAALELLKNKKFESADAPASQGRPYRAGIAFCLRPSSQPVDFDEGVERFIIARSRIPGAPVKNPWKEGAAKACS